MNNKKVDRVLLLLGILILVIMQYIIAIWPSLLPIFHEPPALRIASGLLLVALLIKASKTIFVGVLYVLASFVLVFYPVYKIEKYFLLKDFILFDVNISSKWAWKGRTTTYHIGWQSMVPMEKSSFQIRKEDYLKLELGDTIVLLKSSQNGVYIYDLSPTREEIARFRVPQRYINKKRQDNPPYEQYSAEMKDSMLQQSHCSVGYVFDKIDDKYYRHLVKVGVDSLHTTTHEFATTDRLYTKIYKRLNIGDKVLLQVSDSLSEVNRVISWQPTEQELEQYQQPQPFDESMIVKDYSRCSKEFEKQMLHESHKRQGVIYDKYEDDYVGAYLEIGIDDKHTRAHILHTYDEKEMAIYNEASVGDTVIVRVSDAIPQLNRVLNWHPTHEEIDKYRTPIKLIEK